jgi:DNA-directed RNA polymerase specialized sigma54-like protein
MKDLVKVIKRKKDKNKEPLSDLAITRLENEEILQHARRF